MKKAQFKPEEVATFLSWITDAVAHGLPEVYQNKLEEFLLDNHMNLNWNKEQRDVEIAYLKEYNSDVIKQFEDKFKCVLFDVNKSRLNRALSNFTDASKFFAQGTLLLKQSGADRGRIPEIMALLDAELGRIEGLYLSLPDEPEE